MARKPTRIAPPAIIADAASALYAQIAASPGVSEADRPLWENAVTKAFVQLMDGVRFDREEDGTFVFPSRSRAGLAHFVNGTCDCEATAEQGQPCWHRAAKRLVMIIEEGARPDPTAAAAPRAPVQAAPAPTPAAPPAGPGRNVAALVQRVQSRRASGRSAQEEVDEVFPPKL